MVTWWERRLSCFVRSIHGSLDFRNDTDSDSSPIHPSRFVIRCTVPDSDDPPLQQPIHNPNHQSTFTSTIPIHPPSFTFSSPSQNTILVLPPPIQPSHRTLPIHPPKTKCICQHHPIQKNAINIQASPNPKTNTQTICSPKYQLAR